MRCWIIMITITINNKEYKVKEAKTKEEKEKGLKGVKELDKNEGMLFYFDPPEEVCSFWMKDTPLPLDIVFINEDQEVISVKQGNPYSERAIVEHDVAYVLEVNQNSGIREGDELEFDEDDEGPVMKVLAPDGSVQMELWGGERIVSRRETKILIKKAKKAELSQEDKDFKALGKYMFKVIQKQDNRDPEYVNLPS